MLLASLKSKIEACIDENNYLDLGYENIDGAYAQVLAEALKGSQVEVLDLSDNNIGCTGMKYLTEVLKDTQITSLWLANNNIRSEGVQYLAEVLPHTKITSVDLSKNVIGIDTAEYLNETLKNNNGRCCLTIDIYCTKNGVLKECISQKTFRNNRGTHIQLLDNRLENEAELYLSKNFKSCGITELKLAETNLEKDDVECLARTFENVQIKTLSFSKTQIMHFNVQYLSQVFERSQVVRLSAAPNEIGSEDAKYLAAILREVKVLLLDLNSNHIGDNGMKYLAPVLKISDILLLNLSSNEIGPTGAKYLAEILPDSKIIQLYLGNNNIGAEGAKFLAGGLPRSQVTEIHLWRNGIESEGYQYLSDVVNDTNLTSVIVDKYRTNLGRKTKPNFVVVGDAFKKLVLLNPRNGEFEFIGCKNSMCPPFDIAEYVSFIKALNENPNSEVHILKMMCWKFSDCKWDFNMINKINNFVTKIQTKFNEFFNSNLPELVELLGDFNFVDLVKQFEDMSQSDIVKNLLLHRIFYFVDENAEILHPYIYKLLQKYKMPLYKEEIEPNKKEEIISFYKTHQEIDGAQEIVDLFGSLSFK